MLSSIANESEFSKAVNSGKTVVVDFWAEWCHSCKNLEPVLDKLANKFGNKAQFMKINGDDNPEITTEYGVSSYPTILIFKNGEVVEQIAGSYSENALKEILEQYL